MYIELIVFILVVILGLGVKGLHNVTHKLPEHPDADALTKTAGKRFQLDRSLPEHVLLGYGHFSGLPSKASAPARSGQREEGNIVTGLITGSRGVCILQSDAFDAPFIEIMGDGEAGPGVELSLREVDDGGSPVSIKARVIEYERCKAWLLGQEKRYAKALVGALKDGADALTIQMYEDTMVLTVPLSRWNLETLVRKTLALHDALVAAGEPA